jgi:hypothetical protein
VQGPTDFNGPHAGEFVRLGGVSYEIISFPDASQDMTSKAYIADESLATETGLPVFWVSAHADIWNQCRLIAEKVLSTLRYPP